MKADSSIIYLITSIICFTAYTLMNQKRKPTLPNITFEVFSYIYLGFSSILILFTDSTLVTFILNEALWIYYFIYASIFKKNKAVNIVLLILLLINFVLCSIKFNICVNYSLLFVSIIMIILDLLSKNNKKSVYIYFLLVFTSLAALSDLNNINLIGISLTVLTYVFVYYLLIKKHSLKFVFKFIYTLVGFALIDSLLNYFLDNNTLIYILDLAIYLSLIISMFLLEVDTDRKVLGYSFIVMFPYTSLVNNVDFLYKYNVSFNVLLFVILILIYFEKVFKLKEKDRFFFYLLSFFCLL